MNFISWLVWGAFIAGLIVATLMWTAIKYPLGFQ